MLLNWQLLLFVKRQLDLLTLNFEMAEFKSQISRFKSICLVLNSISSFSKSNILYENVKNTPNISKLIK